MEVEQFKKKKVVTTVIIVMIIFIVIVICLIIIFKNFTIIMDDIAIKVINLLFTIKIIIMFEAEIIKLHLDKSLKNDLSAINQN
jgi:hypothetical protein